MHPLMFIYSSFSFSDYLISYNFGSFHMCTLIMACQYSNDVLPDLRFMNEISIKSMSATTDSGKIKQFWHANLRLFCAKSI